METKEQTSYNKVVNIAEDGEITVLDYTFKHSPDFKGATGSKFYPVSREQYEERTTLSSVADFLESAVSEDEVPNQYREHERGFYKYPYKRWAKDIIDADEEGSIMFDQSYSELWPMLREAAELDEEQAFIFECVGGGRCFDKDFEGNVNPELSAIIREFEG